MPTHVARALLVLALCSTAGARAAAPDDIEPLSAERQAVVQELLDATSQIRGLAVTERLLAGQQGTQGLKRYLAREIERELPGDSAADVQRILEWFALLPEGPPIGDYYAELLSSQVAGYFDSASGYLVIVDGTAGAASGGYSNPELAQRFEDAILVHEINHSLQHQYFDLDRMIRGQGALSDGAAALAALVEGDATLVMYSYLFGIAFERFPVVESSLEQMLADPNQLAAMTPNLAATEELLAAPAYVRESLMFPYLWGLRFCAQVQASGGQRLIDHAFANDPPASTEQILHPQKWLSERDEPIEIDLPPAAEGFERRWVGSWGEFGVRMILAERLPEVGIEERIELAAGWGGDRFALYRDARGEILVWVTEWDTFADAVAFRSAAAGAFDGWRVAQTSTTRVVLQTATRRVRNKTAERWFARLAATPATRRQAEPPNLAALGITADDIPKPLQVEDYLLLIGDPVLSELFGNSAAMQGDPESLRRQVDQAQAESLPQVAFVDGGLKIAELGVSMPVPAGKDWVHSQLGAMNMNVITHAPSESALVLGLASLGQSYPLTVLSAGMEAQYRLDGLTKKSSVDTRVDGHEAHMLQFDGGPGGLAAHVWIVRVDEFALIINVAVSGGTPETVERQLFEAVEQIDFGASL